MPETGFLVHNLLFLAVLFNMILYSQQFPDKKVHRLLKSGIDNILNQKYETAKNEFEMLKTNYPALPLGETYLAALEISRSYDLGFKPDNLLILSYLEEAAKKSEILLNKSDNILWNKYFAGLYKGYSAYYFALEEDWLRAFADGISSLEHFDGCLSEDSLFFESYIAIGTFKYWKSSKLQSLNWLPFIYDERDEGLRNLKLAVEKAEYNKFLAATSLAWAYIDIKDYEEAIKLSSDILKKYPENRTFKWILGRAFQDVNPGKSIEIYYEILNSYKNPSVINEVILKHKIAQLYSSNGQNDIAMKLCGEILSKKITDDYSQMVLEERLNRVKILYENLNR